MVTITPIEGGKGQLSINTVPKTRLDCSSPDNAVELTDEEYAVCKESLAPWVGVKVTVREDPADDTGVLAEVDAAAKTKTPAKKPAKKKAAKKKRSVRDKLTGKNKG